MQGNAALTLLINKIPVRYMAYPVLEKLSQNGNVGSNVEQSNDTMQ